MSTDISIEKTRNELIAKPPEHGHWIIARNPQWKAYSVHHCSRCGYYIHDNKLTKRDKLNYCSNCGAIMDERIEDYR